jgi:hypothetical protein
MVMQDVNIACCFSHCHAKVHLSSERSEISNAECCWSFTKLKCIKYDKIMWSFAFAGTRKKCSLNFYVTM